MNKSFIKFITDFGPLLVFFSFYYKNEKNLIVAIPPFIVATLIALIVLLIFEKKIPMVTLLGWIFITLFGGLNIYFNNPIFIYLKPTIINILFGLGLLAGKFFTKEPILKKMLGKSMQLTEEGWKILNLRWVYFFFSLALINEIIWRIYCPEQEYIWVNFKVWGILPITIIFTAFQIPIINKYKLNE